jgi:hypothetical protein
MHSHNRALRKFAAICHAHAPEIALSSRAERESVQRTRSASQARSGRPARILQHFCRRMRRSSSTVDVWPPSPSRGAASFFLRRRRCPPSSSLRNRLLQTPSPGNCQAPLDYQGQSTLVRKMKSFGVDAEWIPGVEVRHRLKMTAMTPSGNHTSVASVAGRHRRSAESARAAGPRRWVGSRGGCALCGVRTGSRCLAMPSRPSRWHCETS